MPRALASLLLVLVLARLPAPAPAEPADAETLAWLRRAASPELRRGAHPLLEGRLRRRLSDQRPAMVEELRTLVDQNSGSRNSAGIAAVLATLEGWLEPLGFALERIPADAEGGPHLIARRPGRGRRYLLVGHVDTIFEADHPFQEMVVEGDVARGPGVRDMKGGLVVLLHALRALEAEGRLEGRDLTLVLNGDEETGSLSSRPLIEREARRADVGLVYEGSYDGRLTTARGGLGQARFTITGEPAHIATRPLAVDANHELAEKMVRILRLNDPAAGTHVNVAPIRGGVKRNQVSGHAEGEVDLRYGTAAEGEELRRRVEEILSTPLVHNPRLGRSTRTEFRLLLHRPPFRETPAIQALARVFLDLGRELGRPLRTAESSGGSDQNLVAAQGTPCLDSLGVSGLGAHTVDELAELDSLVPAAQLSAVALLRLFAADRTWSPAPGE